MKTNIVIVSIIGVFFFAIGAVYMAMSTQTYGHPEWAGSLAILLSGVLMVFIGFYLWLVDRSAGGTLAQDSPTADIDDDDPELGEFSPWSWWPIMLAGAAACVMVGLCVGFWFAYFTVPLLLVAVVGWVYEYYRGHFAR